MPDGTGVILRWSQIMHKNFNRTRMLSAYQLDLYCSNR